MLFRLLLCSLCLWGACSPVAARAGRIVHVAGGQSKEQNAPVAEARLYEPFGTAFSSQGTLWLVEMASGNRLLHADAHGRLQHVGGQFQAGGFSGDGGPALTAQFNGPHNLAVTPQGKVLIADTWNGRIREVDPVSGTVRSLPGFTTPAEKARGQGPYCITLDFTGTTLYIANLQQVLALDLETSELQTVAGNGKKGRPEDGAVARDAPLVDPRAVAVDRQGRVYVLERGGNALRVVETDGTIRTVVNASGDKGDVDGPAQTARLNGPKHLCVDQDNSVLIADAENHRIRRYLPGEQRVVNVAGTGTSGRTGLNGDPLHCQLARPHGVTVHPLTGELYITDSYNDRVLKIVTDDSPAR